MEGVNKDRPRLLIAERDPFMCDAIARALGRHFELEFVGDGAVVLERVKADPPALVILEALLPTLDGFQVCYQIKSDPTTRHIPVLFFTVLLAKERAIRAGADGFLLKPLRRDILLDTIYRLLTKAPEGKGENDARAHSHLCA